MKRLSGGIQVPLTFVVVFCVIFMFTGCSAANHEGFAIYLTQADIPPSQMPSSGRVDLAEKPLIGMADIVTYNAQTHELKLTASAYESIAQLQVPVSGKSFVACVDRKPIYYGAFWTPISSISFDGVTIWKQLGPDAAHIVTLELGYPSPSFYGGIDPRNSPDVVRSFEQAGKLITKLSITSLSELPHSAKGYELYSWPEDGQWNFTLITGTNRNKTLEEITSSEDFISETGWERVHVAGVDGITTVLSNPPRSESVIWLSGLRENAAQTSVAIKLPPAPTIDTIKGYAAQRGLNFQVE